ncbi:MAG: cold shock domain-containing protein [Candidatus Zixiibacteriota bacterium]|nr:MAG: cold shock domain-containing protein [candidate division Zixibacteria bacterium]
MSKGKVKYFNEYKGWGIISSEDMNQDVYVHHSAINMDGYRTLREGQEVLYEVTMTDHGLCASNVTLAR